MRALNHYSPLRLEFMPNSIINSTLISSLPLWQHSKAKNIQGKELSQELKYIQKMTNHNIIHNIIQASLFKPRQEPNKG